METYYIFLENDSAPKAIIIKEIDDNAAIQRGKELFGERVLVINKIKSLNKLCPIYYKYQYSNHNFL